MSETAFIESGCTPSLWQAETKSQPGSASPAALACSTKGGPGLGLEGDVEGLATFSSPEADEPPLVVEVLEAQEAHARVASGRCLG
jgi:hypothetical protein